MAFVCDVFQTYVDTMSHKSLLLSQKFKMTVSCKIMQVHFLNCMCCQIQCHAMFFDKNNQKNQLQIASSIQHDEMSKLTLQCNNFFFLINASSYHSNSSRILQCQQCIRQMLSNIFYMLCCRCLHAKQCGGNVFSTSAS